MDGSLRCLALEDDATWSLVLDSTLMEVEAKEKEVEGVKAKADTEDGIVTLTSISSVSANEARLGVKLKVLDDIMFLLVIVIVIIAGNEVELNGVEWS